MTIPRYPIKSEVVPGIFLNIQIEGGMCKPPTTASTQVTGTGASDYNIDVTQLSAIWNGKEFEQSPQADLSLDANATNILTLGQARYYAYILYLDKFTQTLKTLLVKGTIAAVASVAKVTVAQIQAQIGTSNPFIILWEARVHRDADTTVAQTYLNASRFRKTYS